MQAIALPDLDKLIQLRHSLHRHPELSGQETLTAERVSHFLQQYNPDQIFTGLGGTGIAAVFNGSNPEGPTILFRAELDALPIAETNDLPYSSEAEGLGHKCGHDGHMTILAGLAALLHQQKSERGKVVLLFQPAEETGAGAWEVLRDERFTNIKPDYVFALHNLPGVPLHQVVVRNGVFAAASTGMIVELTGRSSHAAEPENGLNPGAAMAELILGFQDIVTKKEQFQDLTLLTVVHARLGEIAFGTNPGYATVMATLRSYQPGDLKLLKSLATSAAQMVAEKYGLGYKINIVEEFPATVNNDASVELVKRAAHSLQLEVEEAVHPFRWSEDFGHFTHLYQGAFFGLGAGTEQAQLHHADYDFPDALITSGSALFYSIIQEILKR
ncbi:amidohydrolase [Pontibacter sp. MBLB2868]|uniref:amidohydrolase n=1 Tax=Pontibacter sp. MBLB2868 TaxID=3451555 RepID=UPI003F74C77A